MMHGHEKPDGVFGLPWLFFGKELGVKLQADVKLTGISKRNARSIRWRRTT
jgi:hypothetical protein